ncbi:hypothetical protein [Aureimonas sp. AU40]|uniref:hypothetical protein n=1 Tax=Aureimonas sp. AU40 TaxID=1637747 RepID=UPI00078450E8|nr:hypothetical protein [Aureimonas sp. AU40]
MPNQRYDPYSYPPRGMDHVAAARYIGVGIRKFDEMVSDKRMPKPKQIDGREIWDRVELDSYFTDLPSRNADGGNRIDAFFATAAAKQD